MRRRLHCRRLRLSRREAQLRARRVWAANENRFDIAVHLLSEMKKSAESGMDDDNEELEEPELEEAIDDLDEPDLEDDLGEEFEGDDDAIEGDLDDDDLAIDVDIVEDDDATTRLPAPVIAAAEEDEDDDDEQDPDDIEASLDDILKDRLVIEDAETDEDDVPDVDDRGEGSSAVVPKRPDEFVCQSCFLVKHPSQIADVARQLCRDCV